MPPEQSLEQPQINVREAAVAPPPQKTKDKFKLFSAIKLAFGAMKYNIFLLGLGILATFILQGGQALLNPNSLSPAVNSSVQTQISYRVFLTTIPFSIVGMIVAMFMALVIADGAHREREQFGVYARLAFSRFWRYFSSIILAGFAIILPATGVAIVIGAFWAVATLSGNRILEGLSIFLITVGIISVYIWFMATIIRFSLVGYIALFDLAIPVRQTMRRSIQLLEGTGEWFVLKLVGLNFIFLAAITLIIFNSTDSPAGSTLQIRPIYFVAIIFLSTIYTIFNTAMLVILYINRQANKPAIDIQPKKFGWKAYAFIGLIVIGIIVLAFSAPGLIKHNKLNQQKQREQKAAQQKTQIDSKLAVYKNKAHGYALKLPTDFELFRSSPEQGDAFKSQAALSPFIVTVESFPYDPALVYVNDRTTFEAVDATLSLLDDGFQKLLGTGDTTTVGGDINIPGTRHKRGYFITASYTDGSGKELSVRTVIVPKDDGTALMVAITSLRTELKQLEPVIDIIFKSIDLQPN